MTPQTEKKHLRALLKRLFPSAKLLSHPIGVLMQKKNDVPQLLACVGGHVKPFSVLFKLTTWERMWDDAAKAKAELSYAVVDELGVSMRVLPLEAVDRSHPNWRTTELVGIYDDELEEFVQEESVRVPLGIANNVAVPEHRLTERELEAACVAWLREHRPEAVIWHVPTEACHKRWRYFELQGVIRGVADLTVVLPGRVVFVEMKKMSGTVSDSQLEFGRKVQANGQEWVVVRSMQQFKSLFS